MGKILTFGILESKPSDSLINNLNTASYIFDKYIFSFLITILSHLLFKYSNHISSVRKKVKISENSGKTILVKLVFYEVITIWFMTLKISDMDTEEEKLTFKDPTEFWKL